MLLHLLDEEGSLDNRSLPLPFARTRLPDPRVVEVDTAHGLPLEDGARRVGESAGLAHASIDGSEDLHYGAAAPIVLPPALGSKGFLSPSNFPDGEAHPRIRPAVEGASILVVENDSGCRSP